MGSKTSMRKWNERLEETEQIKSREQISQNIAKNEGETGKNRGDRVSNRDRERIGSEQRVDTGL